MMIGRVPRARGMISQAASATVLAVLLIQSVYFHFLVGTGEPRAWHAVAAIAAVAVLAALLAPVIAWLRKRMAAHGTSGTAWLAAAFIVAGWLLTWAIPVPPAPQGMVELQVDATGRKSDAAISSEVWVRLQRDGVSIPPGQLEHDGKWHVDGEFLVSVPGRQPARLSWSGKAGGQLTMVMVSHPWSGQAEVAVGGRREAVDLYSPGSGGKVVTISGEPPTDDRLIYPDRTPLQHWVQAGDGVLIGAALLALFLLLGTRALPAAVHATRMPMWQEVALHALPTVLVGTALLAIYFPGLMTSDSLDQWRQAGSGQYNDGHPLLYAFLIRALRMLWDSPALLAALQVTAMAAAAAWLIALTRRALGARFAVAHVGAWLVALHPMVALTNITIWKDVPYTVSVVVLTAYLVGAVFLAVHG